MDTFNEFKMKPLNNFMTGDIASNYVVKEQQGFPIQGSVGTILNLNPNSLKDINDGLILNIENNTIGSQKDLFSDYNLFKYDNNDNCYVNSKKKQPFTQLTYCGDNQTSELLPVYPNGIKNDNKSPNCKNLTYNNVGSPTLYGETTFGINDVSILTNPNNNIGYEISPFGDATKRGGQRALGQGRYSCDNMLPGYNVPSLTLMKNNFDSYYSEPVSFNDNIPLYQVGNWTKIPGNYLQEFNNQNMCS